jgi:hypothetical protein
MKEFTYAEVVAKAPQIKAVMGESPTVYLRDEPNPPYEKACEFEAGSSVRLGTHVSGYFTAVVQGVRCRWSFDLESYGASGTGQLAPRTDAIRAVMAKLEGRAREQFRDWLVEVATKIRTDATEWRNHADAYINKANVLADIAGAA